MGLYKNELDLTLTRSCFDVNISLCHYGNVPCNLGGALQVNCDWFFFSHEKAAAPKKKMCFNNWFREELHKPRSFPSKRHTEFHHAKIKGKLTLTEPMQNPTNLDYAQLIP